MENEKSKRENTSSRKKSQPESKPNVIEQEPEIFDSACAPGLSCFNPCERRMALFSRQIASN